MRRSIERVTIFRTLLCECPKVELRGLEPLTPTLPGRGQPEKDVRAWIDQWNLDPTPFVWTKTAEEILDSLARYIARISGAGH
jgi:hypothetical protein